jgi:hypothetical protein
MLASSQSKRGGFQRIREHHILVEPRAPYNRLQSCWLQRLRDCVEQQHRQRFASGYFHTTAVVGATAGAASGWRYFGKALQHLYDGAVPSVL